MNERRERQATYYLQKIHKPVLLHVDGSVGELSQRNVNVKVDLPSRIEGQQRKGTMIQSGLAETALHESLADYIASQRRKSPKVNVNRRSGWRLKDMPADTLASYEAWKNNTESMMKLDDVREQAVAKIASQEDRLTQTMPCKYCQYSDRQYACYACGYAREIYTFPLARYNDGNTVCDIPVDVADIIRLNPDAIEYKTRWTIDDNGLMSASKSIVFDASSISKEYVTGEKSNDLLTIDPVDDLSESIEYVVDRWAEEEKIKDIKRSRLGRLQEEVTSFTPELYLNRLQNSVAVHKYSEIKNDKDYNTMLNGLQKELGSRGLELAFHIKYMGMGDSEARFLQAKRVKNQIFTQQLGGSYNVEIALEDAVKTINS